MPQRYSTVNNGEMESDSNEFQEWLRRLYDADVELFCECRTDNLGSGPKVVIEKRASTFVVRRFPNAGLEHEVWCKHYSEDHVRSPKSVLQDTVKFFDTGGFEIKRGFPLLKQATKERSAPSRTATKNEGSIKSTQPRFTEEQLLKLIFEQAYGMCWGGGPDEAVNLSAVTQTLKALAAEITIARDLQLSERLFVVPGDGKGAQLEFISDSLKSFQTKKLGKIRGGARNIGFLIGEVDAIKDAPNSNGERRRLVLKRLLGRGIFMSAAMAQTLENRINEWSIGVENEGHRLLVMCAVTSDGFYLNLENASFLKLDHRLLPYQNDTALLNLIDRLVQLRRKFKVLFRYRDISTPLASAVLLDCGYEIPIFLSSEVSDCGVGFHKDVSASPLLAATSFKGSFLVWDEARPGDFTLPDAVG